MKIHTNWHAALIALLIAVCADLKAQDSTQVIAPGEMFINNANEYYFAVPESRMRSARYQIAMRFICEKDLSKERFKRFLAITCGVGGTIAGFYLGTKFRR